MLIKYGSPKSGVKKYFFFLFWQGDIFIFGGISCDVESLTRHNEKRLFQSFILDQKRDSCVAFHLKISFDILKNVEMSLLREVLMGKFS